MCPVHIGKDIFDNKVRQLVTAFKISNASTNSQFLQLFLHFLRISSRNKKNTAKLNRSWWYWIRLHTLSVSL